MKVTDILLKENHHESLNKKVTFTDDKTEDQFVEF